MRKADGGRLLEIMGFPIIFSPHQLLIKADMGLFKSGSIQEIGVATFALWVLTGSFKESLNTLSL